LSPADQADHELSALVFPLAPRRSIRAPAPTFIGPLPAGSASPLARHLLALTRQRSPAGQQLIFRATAKALGWEPSPEQEIILTAVREADEDLRKPASRAAYTRWHAAQVADGRADLPTPGQVARAFDNSWRLLRAIERGEPMPAADVYAGLLLATIGGSGPAELTLAAIRAWWADGSKTSVSYGVFRTWIREQLSLALAHGLRRQVRFSPEAIRELFGSWKGAVEQAGLLPQLSREQVIKLANTAVRYSDEELLSRFSAVVISAVERGVSPADMTSAAYVADCRRMQAAAAEEDSCLDLPTTAVIYERLGSFDEAMVKAGFWTAADVERRMRFRGQKLFRTDLKALVLRAAIEVAGERDQPTGAVSWRQFLRWRDHVYANEKLLVPHPVTINKRLQTSPWPNTVALVVAEWQAGSLSPAGAGPGQRSGPGRPTTPGSPMIEAPSERRCA
jgi:hypothetical protein